MHSYYFAWFRTILQLVFSGTYAAVLGWSSVCENNWGSQFYVPLDGDWREAGVPDRDGRGLGGCGSWNLRSEFVKFNSGISDEIIKTIQSISFIYYLYECLHSSVHEFENFFLFLYSVGWLYFNIRLGIEMKTW